MYINIYLLLYIFLCIETYGNIVSMQFDRDTGRCWFAHNGTWTDPVPAAHKHSDDEKGQHCVDCLRTGRLAVSVYSNAFVELV